MYQPEKMTIDRIMCREDLAQWWNELPNPKKGMPPRSELVEAVIEPVMEPTGSLMDKYESGFASGHSAVTRTFEFNPKIETITSRPLTFCWTERSELGACRMLAAIISIYLSQFEEDEEIIVRVPPEIHRETDFDQQVESFRCRVRIVCNPERRRLKGIDEDRVWMQGPFGVPDLKLRR